MPRAMASCGDFSATVLPPIESVPSLGRIRAEHQAHGFRAARAEQAGKTDGFARVDIERDVRHFRCPRARLVALIAVDAALGEIRFLDRAVLLHDGGERAAEHGRDELQLVHRRHRAFRDGLAVAHDRDAVAQRIQFVQPMRDEDHRAAVVAQAAHDGEQQLDFAFVERGSGFVHDDHLRVRRYRARKRHHLLDRGRKLAHGLADIDLQSERIEQFLGAAVNRLPVDQPETGAARGREKCSRQSSGTGRD